MNRFLLTIILIISSLYTFAQASVQAKITPIEMLIGDLQKDGALIPQVREAAIRLLADDPKLIKPENRMLREHYKELFAQTFDWSQIG